MKRILLYVVCPIIGFVLLAVFVSGEVAWTLVFGWIGFLWRVVPELSPNWEIIAVGCTAVFLFAAGLHWVGWSMYRSPGRRWRLRWTLSVVLMVFVMFAAGTGFIGVVHQTGWLLSAEEPLTGTTLKNYWLARSSNNMHMIGIAYKDTTSSYGSLRYGIPPYSDGQVQHSWETYLLPFMGWDLRDIDFKRPWDDPLNEKSFKCVLRDFINPEFRTVDIVDSKGYGLSHYAANIRVLGPNGQVSPEDMKNGTSNTMLVGEVNTDFKPWGDPVNWRDPGKGINNGPDTFGGAPSSRGANFLMADGSVRFMSEKTDPRVLRALSDPTGREKMD